MLKVLELVDEKHKISEALGEVESAFQDLFGIKTGELEKKIYPEMLINFRDIY